MDTRRRRRGRRLSNFNGMAATILLLSLGLTAQVASAGTVRGTISDEGGRALSDVQILLDGPEVRAVTAADGSFELLEVPDGNHRLEARRSGYTAEAIDLVVEGDEPLEVSLQLTWVSVALDEIEITASHSILREDPVSQVGLSRDQIQKLPHFGDDLYRAIAVLPGTSGGDFSAAFNVRGGFHDEVLARIDGVEVFEPFHLKDFQGVFSILDPQVSDGVDLVPGGYPVEYGDRMTGVLDMTTARPTELRTSVGVSFSNIWAGTAGTFADGRGRWLGSVRRGFLDLVLALTSEEEEEGDEDPKPRYWDLFGKLDYDLTDSQSMRLEMLGSEDTLDFKEVDGDEDFRANTSYGNQYLWLRHLALLGAETYADSVASVGRIDRNREALFTEVVPPELFVLQDERDSSVLTLRSDWNHQLTESHYLKGGLELRRWETDYDYANELDVIDEIEDPRFFPGERQTEFSDSFASSQYAVYLADRFRLHPRLTSEIGVRWDRQTLTGEDQFSPRVHLVLDLESGGVVRAGWGHFFQSQRPYELGVEFGETEFQTAQRAEHWTLGYETDLGTDFRLRIDAFRRDIDDPLVRYETLFDPFNTFPEARIDLIRVAPEGAVSNGVEILLRTPRGKALGGWLSYAWSEVEDRTAGEDVKRYIDQTHSVTGVVNWNPSPKWSLTWVVAYHTGWPSTPLSAERVEGDDGFLVIDYTVGAFYSERLDDYARLDFRASRTSRAGRGYLTYFLDVRNLFNRDNPRGLAINDPEFFGRPDGTVEVVFPVEDWLPILPSFGISYEF